MFHNTSIILNDYLSDPDFHIIDILPIDSLNNYNIAPVLPVIAITIALTIYLTNKIFSLKELRGQKKNMMFTWVHNNLIGNVYIPLSSWTHSICLVLKWDKLQNFSVEYKTHILLYRISKLLNYVYQNRSIVGANKFFTNCEKSNEQLSILLTSIIEEIRSSLASPKYKEKTIGFIAEDRIISIEFLSRLGECDSYTNFLLHFYGKNIKNEELEIEVINLRNSLAEENGIPLKPLVHEHADYCKNSFSPLFDEDDIGYKWQKAKLYAYCYLFSFLMNYELHNMYDSWYKEKRRKYKMIHKNIETTIKFINRGERHHCQYLTSKSNFSKYGINKPGFSMDLNIIRDFIDVTEESSSELYKELIKFSIYSKLTLKNSEFLYGKSKSIQKNSFYIQVIILKIKQMIMKISSQVNFTYRNKL